MGKILLRFISPQIKINSTTLNPFVMDYIPLYLGSTYFESRPLLAITCHFSEIVGYIIDKNIRGADSDEMLASHWMEMLGPGHFTWCLFLSGEREAVCTSKAQQYTYRFQVC
jgi:hypothetical protein